MNGIVYFQNLSETEIRKINNQQNYYVTLFPEMKVKAKLKFEREF